MITEEKKKYENLIQAFALGALDKEEFIETVHAIESSDDFAWQELGEYQNLTSLLVSFIDPKEVPAQSLEKILTKIDEIGSPMPSSSPERKTISFTKLSSFVDEVDATPEPDKAEEEEEDTSVSADPYALGRGDQARPVVNRQPGFQRPGVQTQMAGRGAAEPAPRPEGDERPEFTRDEVGFEPETEESGSSGFMPHLSRESISGIDEESFAERTQEEIFESASYGMTVDEPYEESVPRGPINPRRAQRKQLIEQELHAEQGATMAATPAINEEPRSVYREEKRPGFAGITSGPVTGAVSSAAFWGVIGTVVVTFSVVIYIMFSMVTGAEDKLDAKIKELGTAQAKTELLRSTVTMNQNLLLFFSSVKTAGLVNLFGTDDFPETFGKFFYGVKEKRGFLQFTNITTFNSGKGFQLWIQIGGTYLKAGGVNVPDQNIEFFELNDIPDLSQTGTYKVMLTEENVTGADTPSNTVIMSGLLIMKAQETN